MIPTVMKVRSVEIDPAKAKIKLPRATQLLSLRTVRKIKYRLNAASKAGGIKTHFTFFLPKKKAIKTLSPVKPKIIVIRMTISIFAPI